MILAKAWCLICIARDNMQESAGIKARKLEPPDAMVIPG
jgi:hypothetical protein